MLLSYTLSVRTKPGCKALLNISVQSVPVKVRAYDQTCDMHQSQSFVPSVLFEVHDREARLLR